MENQKRALIVAGRLNVGGLENQLVHLALNNDPLRYHLDFVSDRDDCDYKSVILRSGSGYIVLPSNNDVGLWRYCRSLYKLLKARKYDVVHSHELFHSGIVTLVAWLAGVPKRIAHSHSTKDTRRNNNLIQRLYHVVMRLVLRITATDYLACSTEAGRFLYGKNAVKSPRFRVIYNSVDTTRFFLDMKEPPFEPEAGWKYIVHVGRFVPLKNHRLILSLANMAKQRGDRYRFVLVGDGELYEPLQTEALQKGLNRHLVFMGSRNDVPDILRLCDAFLLPSQYEGMPLSLIEAQAAGLPSVVADHITDEVDFSLSLVRKVSLSEPLEKWYQAVSEAVNLPHPDSESIQNSIARFGFDSSDFAKRVFDVYEK